MRRIGPRRLLAVLLAVSVMVVVAGIRPLASAAGEPAYDVPESTLAAAVTCPSGGFTHPAHEPVLLVHGTFATPKENWGGNYALVLPQLGYDVCTVTLPNRALGDIQVAAEYVVYAVKYMYGASGLKVNILGHSQGPLEPRWAIKWWPSLQSEVDHLVMMAAPNHGTVVADASIGAAAGYQMKPGSKFLDALNAGDETPGPVSYTSLYSATDELVQPASTAVLNGADNILMQDVCPGRVVEHVQFAVDAVAFALVMDAFTHPGQGADPARIDKNVCTQGAFPGVDWSKNYDDLTKGWPFSGQTFALAEPALKCYAASTC
jgi:triacylglycerol lipase